MWAMLHYRLRIIGSFLCVLPVYLFLRSLSDSLMSFFSLLSLPIRQTLTSYRCSPCSSNCACLNLFQLKIRPPRIGFGSKPFYYTPSSRFGPLKDSSPSFFVSVVCLALKIEAPVLWKIHLPRSEYPIKHEMYVNVALGQGIRNARFPWTNLSTSMSPLPNETPTL